MPHIFIGAAVFAAGYAFARFGSEGLTDFVKYKGRDIANAGAKFAKRSKPATGEITAKRKKKRVVKK